MIVVIESDALSLASMQGVLGQNVTAVPTLEQAQRILLDDPSVEAAVVGPQVDLGGALQLAGQMRIARPLLGVIVVRSRIDTALLTEALRAGVREVISDRDTPGLDAAVRRVVAVSQALRDSAGMAPTSTESGNGSPSGRLVSVFSAKGGCGKTTLSTNLAAALADGGRRRVCIVDLDLAFGDVAIVMQLFPARTLADAVPLSDSLDEGALEGLATQHSAGLVAYVAPVEPGIGEVISAPLVARILRMLKGMYDYVVVDTPPAFTDHVLAAIDESDVVALIATLDIPALKNLKLTLETLDLLNYPRDRWRVVVNRSDSKVGLALSEVEKTLNMSISVEIPSSRAVPAAINRGVPIVLDDPSHAVSAAIRRFADQIASEAPAREGVIAPSRRVDQRRFGRRRSPEHQA